MKFRLLLFFCLVSALLLNGAEKQELDSVLAAVNGDPVTLGEILPSLREAEFRLGNSYSGKELEKRVLELRRRAVDEIIDRKLIIADFNEKKLNIPTQEVENEIDRWGRHIGCSSRKDLEDRLKESGTSVDAVRKKIRERMIVQVMRRREYLLAGPPSPADLYKRFKEQESKLSYPGSVELGILKIGKDEPEKADTVAAALKKDPSSWRPLARIYAIDPAAEDGSVGEVELPMLRPEFAKAMTDMAPGRIYPKVPTADGVYFLKILKLKPKKAAVFKEHAEAIRKTMEEEVYRKSSADYSARLRDRAVIEYFFPAPEGVEKK
ncbi:MAG: SurA N-terminal domain-containing protein [Lentisphaeria bacterium]|nr:SurA N-terminal domain-containing protein [Lentisphaeria bacterium]